MTNNDGYQCLCGGEVIPCKDFPLPDGTDSWYSNFGYAKMEKAGGNPEEFICIHCGAINPPVKNDFPPFWTDTCPI